MLHKSAAEHLDKLIRVAARVDREVHKDDLDDFFKTAYHLVEITEKDPPAARSKRRPLRRCVVTRTSQSRVTSATGRNASSWTRNAIPIQSSQAPRPRAGMASGATVLGRTE
jgi:hypothetical protein